KAVMEMESFEGGTLAHIAVPEGGKVPVGGTIAYLATGKENAADVKAKFAGAAASSRENPAAAPRAESKPAAAKSETNPAAATVATVPALEPTSKPLVATMEHAARGEVHEHASVGHGATRETAHPIPPLQH